MSTIVSSIAGEYRRYKALGEAAIAQVNESELSRPGTDYDNSIPVLVWHVSGNLKSRFSDFRTTDGEKSWRHRDEEFAARTVTKQELSEKWEDGWQALFAALEALSDDDLHATITIRGQAHTISEALQRSLAHTNYHVGQIVYIAKAIRGAEW